MNFEKNILEKKEDHRLKIEHSDTFDLILNSESFNIDNYDVDDETFYFILLCHDLEGDEDFVFDFLRKHKNSNIDFDAIKKDIINLNSELKEKEEIDYEKRRRDEEKRKECSNFFSEEINLMEGFFKPKEDKEIIWLSFIDKKGKYEKGGFGCDLGNKYIIISSCENMDNAKHEFLHSIINPIVEKIIPQLTKNIKEKIVSGCSTKHLQDYGKESVYVFSHLAENFINTYVLFYSKGIDPKNRLDEIKDMVGNIKDDEELENILDNNIYDIDKKICLNELKSNLDFYFNKYLRSELMEVVYDFYEDYEDVLKKDDGIDFENYCLENFISKLDNNL